MKKMKLSIFAALAAIALSAFATTSSMPPPYKYYDDLEELREVPPGINVPQVCPPANVKQCKINIGGVDRLIFHSDGVTPFMRN